MFKDHASVSGGSAPAVAVVSPVHQAVSPPVPLARGREFLSIPGPTNVPEVVLQAMHRPAVDIYADELLETTGQCLADLRSVFRTEGSTYIYISNGHGAWEAALTNTLSRGDHVLVLESGRFAVGWGEQGDLLGLQVEVLPCDWRKAVDPAAVAARLKADTLHKIKASSMTFRRSARRSMRQGIRRCSWSMASPRSAAWNTRWTGGASIFR
jgi:alanine-glyoxylate transaminase / serine-glyoxylate transaminase / serine-pyruvate transaminase